MNVINQFLGDSITDNFAPNIKCSDHALNGLNKLFAGNKPIFPCLRILPKIKQNQIWSIKQQYLDYEGNLQSSTHPILVVITTNPEMLDDDNEFVRVCPISPFVEMASKSDQICDDSSVIGFPFLVETWNEQPIMTDILDKYVGDYYIDFTEKNEVLSNDQKEFRKIEISNARYLNHTIIAYTNEKERSDAFSFSVDLQYSTILSTKHMPIKNANMPHIIALRDNEEYAAVAKTGHCITDNDCVDFNNSELPFKLEVRKKDNKFVITIIPKVEIHIIDSHNQELIGTSNSERIVYDGLNVGLYHIKCPMIDNDIKIRLK